ncbi:MAG: hypothetical protein QMD82_00350 [bacterium]|nr:hypothetical protein [bacterium]
MKSIKRIYVKIAFWLLGRIFTILHGIDPEVKKYWQKIKNSNSFGFLIEPSGPCLLIEKQNSKIKSALECSEKADILFIFKTLNSAFEVFTAQKSTISAYLENRILIKGDIGEVMWFMRIVDRLEFYLFPRIIARRVIKKLPEMGFLTLSIRRFLLLLRFITG